MDTLRRLMLWKKASGGSSPLYKRTIINNPAVFTTEVARPLKGLSIPFLPVQSGTGDPTPSNIRPISGWTGLKITRTGKSIFPFLKVEKEITIASYNGYSDWFDQLTIEQGLKGISATYSVEIDATEAEDDSNSVAVWAQNKSGGWVYIGNKGNNIAQGEKGVSKITVNIIDSISWITFGLSVKKGCICRNPMVEVGSTATAYEPYSGTTIPVSWQTDAGEVYGGTLDALTGVLSVEWARTLVSALEWTYDNTYTRFSAVVAGIKKVTTVRTLLVMSECFESITDGRAIQSVPNMAIYCGSNSSSVFVKDTDESDSTTFIQKYGTTAIVYPLATPITYQLDPVTMSTLIGENVIWTDTNSDNTIVYLSKTQGGGLGGGLGGGFGGGSDEPDEPGDPDNPDNPDNQDEPDEPPEPDEPLDPELM